jgi:hypothetical protein
MNTTLYFCTAIRSNIIRLDFHEVKIIKKYPGTILKMQLKVKVCSVLLASTEPIIPEILNGVIQEGAHLILSTRR